MNGERIAFENWLGIKPCGAAHDLAWAAWKARAYLPAPQQATPEPVGEPWGWAVNSTLFRGEFAEADAKAEAKRCGGTTRAVALYTNPAPAASAEREARVIEQNARKAAQEQLYAERERHTAEVKRLQAEIGRLKAPAASVSDAVAIVRERYRGTKWGKAAECICDAVDEAILALRPAQAGVQDDIVKNAQRYRWLRRKACVIGKTTYCGEETGQPILDFVNLPDVTNVISRDSATTLDAAIDAAMLAAAPKEGGAA